MNNIGKIKNCYGCGVCAITCSKKIIDISYNDEGFYEPRIIDSEKCTECGLCLSVCSYYNEGVSLNTGDVLSYASWSLNDKIRKECSSGGIGFEIGRYLLNYGYKLCGVKYNSELNRAEHFIAENESDWKQSVGSKYIQSYFLSALKKFDRNEKYFVTGTPCQIDSLRRYIKKFKIEDNFILMDFFCHGVPSINLWKKYLEENEKKVGTIKSASWRSKKYGWHNSWMISLFGDNLNYESLFSEGDLFFRFFLGNYCLNKCCYKNCKFKYLSSSADLRIGDMWGNKYSKNDDGVNSLIVLTEKGRSIINKMEDCLFVEEDLKYVSEGQYKKSAKAPFIRKCVIKELKGNKSLSYIHSLYCKPYIYLNFPKRVIMKIKNKFK